MALEESAFENRPNVIGGSEVSTVIGINKYQSPLSLWATKKGYREKGFTNRHKRMMRSGKVLEDMVIDEYKNDHPELTFTSVSGDGDEPEREAEFKLLDRDTQVPVIECHLDSVWITKPVRGRKTASVETVEVKTFNAYVDVSSHSYPDEWFVQTQIGMHAMNSDPNNTVKVGTSLILAYDRNSGELHPHRVQYDREYCEQIMEACTRWKRRYLDNVDELSREEIQKELVNQGLGHDCIPELFELRETTGETISLDSTSSDGFEAAKLANAYREYKERELNAKKEAERVRAELLNKMTKGEEVAETLMIDGERVVTFKSPQARAPAGFKIVREVRELMCEPDSIRKFSARLAEKTSATQLECENILPGLLHRRLERVEKDLFDAHKTIPNAIFRTVKRGIELAQSIMEKSHARDERLTSDTEALAR